LRCRASSRRSAGAPATATNGLSGHVAKHVGKIQVLRRKLGKPVLF
jgi:hypothetical protein